MQKKLDLICVTIDRLKLAFQGKPSNTGESGNSFLGKLKDSLSGAIMDVFNIEKVKLTANALTTAGFTIKSLAKGMKEWMDTSIDMEKITGLSNVLVCVRDIFSVLGDKEQKNNDAVGGWLGRKLAKFAPSDVEKGVKTSKYMGDALESIAKGLVKFHDTYAKKFSETKLY